MTKTSLFPSANELALHPHGKYGLMTKTVFPQNLAPEPKAQKAQQNSHMTQTTAILATVLLVMRSITRFGRDLAFCLVQPPFFCPSLFFQTHHRFLAALHPNCFCMQPGSHMRSYTVDHQLALSPSTLLA